MKLASMIGILMLQTSFASENIMTSFDSLTPPKAQQKAYSFKIHDHTIQDPYAWLRDSKWTTPEDSVKDEEILSYIQQENKYRDAFFDEITSAVDEIFLERKGYIAKVDESVPIKRDDYFYYSRQKLEQNYRAFYRKKGDLNAEEELIMDVNAEALNYTFFSLGYMAVSPSHQLLAYSADTKGNEFFELRIRDIEKQKELSDVIPSVASLVWLPDSSGFYYLQYNKEWRTKKLFFHRLGNEVSKDDLIYEEKGEIPSLGIQQSFDKKYLFLNSDTKQDSEIFYIDLTSEEQKLQRLMDRMEKRLVSAEHRNGDFYFLMNDTGSNFRLVKRHVLSDKTDNLTEVIAHDSAIYLRDFVPYAQGLVLATRENGLNRLAIYDEEKKEARYIKMPDTTYDLRLVPTTYDDSEIRYSYSSLSKPETVFATTFDMKTTKTLKIQEIPSGFDAEKYVAERIWAEARDGVKVPISLVYRKDKVQKDGKNPLLLYGYGSYGYGISAGFSSRALSYVNQGFVYAIAHIRGGDDLGYQWYLDGKLLKKKNTFNDFIDVAETLIKQGYTTQGMIAAMGGSAGGMLMGAIANERPELFKAIIAHVPFVDVINTMLDETLPLTPGEFVEWGNPKEDKTSFEYMLSYSPYDNVKPQNYPAIYMTGGLTDPRVTYWEPTKWLAKLRDNNQGKAPLLMKMHMEAGHAGGSKRDEGLREDAEDLAFLLKVFGKI
jgi:oligopeptidase B